MNQIGVAAQTAAGRSPGPSSAATSEDGSPR